MNLLILSVIALFAGPLLYYWMRRGGLIARTVEQIIVVVLVGVVVFLLVPETLEALGPPALLMIAAGYLVPGILELVVRRAAHAFHLLSLLLALAGLALHAALDGAGLAGSERQGDSTLGLAIVLHRFGMGLVLWLMVVPALGRKIAIGVLAVAAAATFGGYAASEHLLDLQTANSVLLVQSLVIGTIIHSLVHREHTERLAAHAGR